MSDFIIPEEVPIGGTKEDLEIVFKSALVVLEIDDNLKRCVSLTAILKAFVENLEAHSNMSMEELIKLTVLIAARYAQNGQA